MILSLGDLDAAVDSLRTFLRTHFTDVSLYTSNKESRPVPLHKLFVNMEWEFEDEPSSGESDESSDSDSPGSPPDSSSGNPHIQSDGVMWERKEDKQKESESNITTKDEAPVLQAFLKRVCIIFTLNIKAVCY